MLKKKRDIAVLFSANEATALAFKPAGQAAKAVIKLVAKPA